MAGAITAEEKKLVIAFSNPEELRALVARKSPIKVGKIDTV